MSKKVVKILSLALVLILSFSLFTGCSKSETAKEQPAEEAKDKKIKIGFSMDTLKEERWQRDRDMFVAKAEAFGAEVLVQAANGDDALQVSQAENLISQGIDVLVVVPHNAEACATIVEMAHEANIPVIAYDRLIKNSDVDLYVSFDNVKVGEMQAQYITELVPEGDYVLIGGAPTDNNALLFREGQMNIIKPLADAGKIKILADPFSDEWKPEEAQNHMENALTQHNNKVNAVVASNDGTAGGAIQALAEQGLAGKIPVSGQDAELAACQRIVEGTQSMTIYKPIQLIAETVAEISIKMAKNETVTPNNKVNNGKIDVPSVLLEPISVDANNINDTIIKDGFHKVEDVYKNVAKDKWPAQ